MSHLAQEPCYEGRWFYFAMWSCVAVVLFVIGIPYLFVSLVRDQRRRHVDVYLQQLYGKGFTRVSGWDLLACPGVRCWPRRFRLTLSRTLCRVACAQAEQLRNKGTCSARLLICWYRRIRPVIFSFDHMLTAIFTVDKEKRLDLRVRVGRWRRAFSCDTSSPPPQPLGKPDTRAIPTAWCGVRCCQALYRADQQPEVLEGVLRKERRNLRLAARKDLTDRNTIIRGTTSNMVRQFLYRDNLDSSHAKDRVGFLYSAYKFQCVPPAAGMRSAVLCDAL